MESGSEQPIEDRVRYRRTKPPSHSTTTPIITGISVLNSGHLHHELLVAAATTTTPRRDSTLVVSLSRTW
jgi:hypothetical protein